MKLAWYGMTHDFRATLKWTVNSGQWTKEIVDIQYDGTTIPTKS